MRVCVRGILQAAYLHSWLDRAGARETATTTTTTTETRSLRRRVPPSGRSTVYFPIATQTRRTRYLRWGSRSVCSNTRVTNSADPFLVSTLRTARLICDRRPVNPRWGRVARPPMRYCRDPESSSAIPDALFSPSSATVFRLF